MPCRRLASRNKDEEHRSFQHSAGRRTGKREFSTWFGWKTGGRRSLSIAPRSGRRDRPPPAEPFRFVKLAQPRQI